MTRSLRQEECCNCASDTGKAGRGDGSLYDTRGDGPYCEECWSALPQELRGDE